VKVIESKRRARNPERERERERVGERERLIGLAYVWGGLLCVCEKRRRRRRNGTRME